MKLTNIIYGAAILTAATSLATSSPKHVNRETTPTAHNQLSQLSGQESKHNIEAKRSFDAALLAYKRATEDAALLSKRHPEAAAEAMAAPEPYDKAKHRFCYRPGEPCYKLKRAAEAAAEAMAAPEPYNEAKHRFCYRPGEPCYKARRDELDLAAHALKIARDGLAPGVDERGEDSVAGVMELEEPGYKAKLDIIEARAALAVAQVEEEPVARSEDFSGPGVQTFCDTNDGPCAKTKRTAEAVAAAVALEDRAADPYNKRKHRFCYRPGEPCYKAKRAVEEISKLVGKI